MSSTTHSVFPFDFTLPLPTNLPTCEGLFTPKYSITSTEPSHLSWPSLEFAKPSTKTSRFTWSETDYSNGENTLENFSVNQSASTTELGYGIPSSDCSVCSMVPYGAVCINCNQIQRSKAIALAAPPAASWPITHTLGDWEGTAALEEELLRNLDTDLLEQLDVPHELDEWGRRVYNDCGHRILYYQDADGNTVVGYEAWYPSSVMSGDDYYEGEVQNGCYAVDDEKTAISGYEADSETTTLYDDNDDDVIICTLDFEQHRFAEFLAASDDELSRFSADRERIAKWIAAVSVSVSVADDDEGDDGDISVFEL